MTYAAEPMQLRASIPSDPERGFPAASMNFTVVSDFHFNPDAPRHKPIAQVHFGVEVAYLEVAGREMASSKTLADGYMVLDFDKAGALAGIEMTTKPKSEWKDGVEEFLSSFGPQQGEFIRCAINTLGSAYEIAYQAALQGTLDSMGKIVPKLAAEVAAARLQAAREAAKKAAREAEAEFAESVELPKEWLVAA